MCQPLTLAGKGDPIRHKLPFADNLETRMIDIVRPHLMTSDVLIVTGYHDFLSSTAVLLKNISALLKDGPDPGPHICFAYLRAKCNTNPVRRSGDQVVACRQKRENGGIRADRQHADSTQAGKRRDGVCLRIGEDLPRQGFDRNSTSLEPVGEHADLGHLPEAFDESITKRNILTHLKFREVEKTRLKVPVFRGHRRVILNCFTGSSRELSCALPSRRRQPAWLRGPREARVRLLFRGDHGVSTGEGLAKEAGGKIGKLALSQETCCLDREYRLCSDELRLELAKYWGS